MDVHKLLHCNLQQLDLLFPRTFSISEGMFKVVNIKGFQETIHYLLNIVDAEGSAKVIQFPILDKKGESQFRVGVKKMLTELKEKHPEADFPNIFPSFLMQPGGDKFVYFMWKFTKFVLYKSIIEKYGEEAVLLPPRTKKGDAFAEAKLNLLNTLIHAETQRALEYQSKIDSAISQKCEWEYNLELNALDEEIRRQELELSKVIAEAPVTQSVKDQLQNEGTREAAIAEWTNDVEAEGRLMEALVHSMSKYATPLTELCDIISLAESNKSAQLCLDSDGLSIDSNRDGDGSKVNIIGYFQNLNKMLVPMTSELRNSFEGSLCLKSYTPALQEMREGLDAIAASYVSMETKLQEKLTQSQNSVDELVAALPDQPSAASLEASPMPSSDDNPISDMLKFTPDRGACRDLFKDKHRTEVAIDPKFFKTPEIDSPSTPVTKYERKQCDTPLSYSSVKSVARKPHNSDLRALTSSLVKKAKWNDVQRCSNKLGSANAKLFQPKPLLGPVESRPVNEDIFCLKVEDDDVTKSPSLLLASPSEEVEHKVSKPSSRRSSLEAIIQRYQKLRSGMSNDISKI